LHTKEYQASNSKFFKIVIMKIEQTHIDEIRTQFASLQTKEDLVELLSKAKNLMYGVECKPVQLKHLTYYANPYLSKNRYQKFTIKTKI
jgi:RNA-directed DNA polymerase